MVETRSNSRLTPKTPRDSPAGNALSIDPVQKARTISHMNKEHADDMVAILRHYAGLTEAQAADAQMQDLDLANITISCRAGARAVPFTPPMHAWADRRSRLVDMVVEARKALGIEVEDHAPVKFFRPEGWGIVSFAGVLWYFLSAAVVFSGNMEPGSRAWRFIEAIHLPIGPELYVWLVVHLLGPMLIIHIVESAYMAKSRLEPKGVAVGSAMWWKWVVCAFLEGAPCWKKWDRRVLGKNKAE